MHGQKRSEYKSRLLHPETATKLATKAQQWNHLSHELLTQRRRLFGPSSPPAGTNGIAADADVDVDASVVAKPSPEILLTLTEKMLSVNPDPSHLWNIRREMLFYVPVGPTSANDDDVAVAGNLDNSNTPPKNSAFEVQTELTLTAHCLMRNPKSYSAWYHRKWALVYYLTHPTDGNVVGGPSSAEEGPDAPKVHLNSMGAILQSELDLCVQFLQLDERNFHCWNYRRFVVAILGSCGSTTSACTAVQHADMAVKSDLDLFNGSWSSWLNHSQGMMGAQLSQSAGSAVGIIPIHPKQDDDMDGTTASCVAKHVTPLSEQEPEELVSRVQRDSRSGLQNTYPVTKNIGQRTMATSSSSSSTIGRHPRWASASILSVAALAVSTTSSFPIPSSPSTTIRISSIPSQRRVTNAGSVRGSVGAVHLRLRSSSLNQQNNNESTNINESTNDSISDSISSNISSNISNNNSNNSRRSRRKPRLPDKNLYSILGASPTMSRSQIKRLYITLAKQTHPDSSTSTSTPTAAATAIRETDRFNEIARAWTVLSDPKTRRTYDRELAAQDFKADVVSKAGEMAREYGPSARKFYDDFAIPFLRRTTATTLAGWSALEKEVGSSGSADAEERVDYGDGDGDRGNNNNRLSGVTLSEVVKEVSEMERRNTGVVGGEILSSTSASGGDALEDFGKAFQRVFEAGRNVTRQIDGMEMQEKSLELRARANETKAESTEVLERLTKIKSKRLRLTFRTSSANFTSKDALQYLNGFDTTDNDNDGSSSMPNIDSVTLMQRMAFKNPIGRDIKALNIAESDFDKRNAAKAEVDRRVDDRHRALLQAERDSKSATEAEERARKMLEDARKRVTDSVWNVAEAKESIRDMHTTVKVSDRELSKASAALKKKRDVVRRQMKHKHHKANLADAENAKNAKGNEGGSMFDLAETGKVRLNPDFDKSSMNEMGFERQTVETIRELQKEEDGIEAEFARLVGEASRLVSQSETMRLRSDKLIGEQWEQLQQQQQQTMTKNNAQVTNDP